MEPSKADAISARAETDRACKNCGAPSGSREMCTTCLKGRLEAALERLRREEAAESADPVIADAVVEAERIEASRTTELDSPDEAGADREDDGRADERTPTVIAVPEDEPSLIPDLPDYADDSRPPRGAIAPPTGSAWRRRRNLLAVLALGAAALATVLVIGLGGGESSDPAPAGDPAPAEPAAPAAEPDPAPAEPALPDLTGTFGGEIAVSYKQGAEETMTQSIEFTGLAEGERAGFSRSTQNDVTCRGPLVFRGASGDALRFSYRERNTAECIAASEIRLTPRGEDRLSYREVTDSTVGRGTLVRE